jgi:uncharacterized protein (DUF1778 family)
MRRDRRIIFRVSDAELAAIEKAAAKDERVLSDFLRLTIMRAVRGKPKRKKE